MKVGKVSGTGNKYVVWKMVWNEEWRQGTVGGGGGGWVARSLRMTLCKCNMVKYFKGESPAGPIPFPGITRSPIHIPLVRRSWEYSNNS
jgi:hypothetical protein